MKLDHEKIRASMSSQEIFAPLNEHQADRLAATGKTVQRKGGACLIHENQTPPGLFIIIKGTLQAVINGTPAGILKPGDIAGEISASGISPPVATLIAQGEVTALLFPSRAIAEAADVCPAFAMHLRRAAFRRISASKT